ncbi:MAG: radical SAM protein [Elusimicrobia bacterium]|nr:radical SAM protein [Elusimicrobiota bacterium]
MAKVFLMNPRVESRPSIPLGLAYIAAVLEQNHHQVKVYDPIVPEQDEKIKELLTDFKPDIVGITCTTAQETLALHFTEVVKGADKNYLVVIGGPHISALPRQVLSDKNIDIVVIGEGEETMLEIVNSYNPSRNIDAIDAIDTIKGIGYKKDGKQFFTEPRPAVSDLDKLPFPAWHLFDMKWYLQRDSIIRGKWLRCGTIIAGRGCPGRCIFCQSYQLYGRRVHRRSPENVLKEMNQLMEKYDSLEGIYFCDDTLAMTKPWMMELCKLIKEKSTRRILWACQSRVNTIDTELVKTMKDAGCVQLEFGVESGSQKVLDALHKDIKIDAIRRAFKICRDVGMRTASSFMIGNPEEKMEDVILSEQLADEIKSDYTEFFTITPYPGTELYEMAKKNGWLREGTWLHAGVLASRPVMVINFTADELLALQKRLYSKYFPAIYKSLVLDYRFIFDVVKFSLKKPKHILAYFKIIFKDRSLSELGRYINHVIRDSVC